MSTTCPDALPLAPAPQKLSLPGGAQLVDQDVLRVAQPAIAPLTPFFQLLDVIMGVVKVLKAVPDAFGPPPDPTAIISALGEIAPKVAKLANLVPQLSVPIMVVNSLDVVIAGLQQASNRISSIEALA